jgi:hypothetical protein
MAEVGDSDPAVALTRRERERSRERWTGCKAPDLDAEQLTQAKAAGYEPGPDGYMVGRDRRTMTRAELLAMGHDRGDPGQMSQLLRRQPARGAVVRGGRVSELAVSSGQEPVAQPPSDEQLEAMRERGRRLAEPLSIELPEAKRSALRKLRRWLKCLCHLNLGELCQSRYDPLRKSAPDEVRK